MKGDKTVNITIKFKFQSDSINTGCIGNFEWFYLNLNSNLILLIPDLRSNPATSCCNLNSNLILLILKHNAAKHQCIEFKFQSDSINTSTSSVTFAGKFHLNSNLILLIQDQSPDLDKNRFPFKFQSDSINTKISHFNPLGCC